MNATNLSISALRLTRITCPCRTWQLQAILNFDAIPVPLYTGAKRGCQNLLRKMLLATFQTQRHD